MVKDRDLLRLLLQCEGVESSSDPNYMRTYLRGRNNLIPKISPAERARIEKKQEELLREFMRIISDI